MWRELARWAGEAGEEARGEARGAQGFLSLYKGFRVNTMLMQVNTTRLGS